MSSEFNERACANWSEDDVTNFLVDIGLESLVDLFRTNKIDGRALRLLSDKSMKDMGIVAIGDRLKLNEGILNHSGGHAGKVFNDPIHGHIELHPCLIAIMDTPQFQRLRYIKQLGACYFVFPGASHNRFEHSVGVAHLAGELVKTLMNRQPELNITAVDLLCVQIAGLCHDLGHGPFSHLYDGKFIPAILPESTWHHEQASVDMFDYLIDDPNNELAPVLSQYGIRKRDIEFIKEQIIGPQKQPSPGKWTYRGRGENKRFLYEIVANKRNGIDVDKWDYFARDCHHLGISNSFDHLRFMKFARVLKDDDTGAMQICSRDKEVYNIYGMFHIRSSLHRRAYQHKTNQIIECMLTEAFIKADPFLLFKGKGGKMLKMSQAKDDMVAYMQMTDHVAMQIIFSDDEKLQPSKNILQKIQRRDLYKCVGQTQPNLVTNLQDNINDKNAPGSLTEDEMKVKKRLDVGDFIKRLLQDNITDKIAGSLTEEEMEVRKPLEAEDFIVRLANFDYGSKNENPIDNVMFYGKNNPNKAFHIRKQEVSRMLPESFSEQYIRVYSKKTDTESLETATLCFTNWCRENNMITKDGNESMVELTPFKKSEKTIDVRVSSVKRKLNAEY